MEVIATTSVAAFATIPQEVGEAEPLQAHIAFLENNTAYGSLLPDLGHQENPNQGGHVTYNITLGHHYKDKFDSRLLWYEDYIVGSFLVLVGILSFIGNGSSVIMFWRRYKNLTPAELLLFNLAVIHLLLAIGSYPAAMVSSFSHRWVFHDLGCQIYGFVCYLIGIATIASMTALAMVRYLKTCTHTYSRTLTVAHVKIVIIGVYSYAGFWSILPLFSIISQYEVEPFGTSCTLNWSNPSTSSRLYIILAVTFIVCIPYVIMTWCYIRIVLLVRRNHMKKTIMGRKSNNSKAPTQMQLTIVSLVVCFGYLVAWCPYAIASLVYGIGQKKMSVYVSLIPVLLAKSSCAYNPIIYVFVTARYRKEMKNILHENINRIYCCFRGVRNKSATGSFTDINQSSVAQIALDHVSPPGGDKSPFQISPSPNTKVSYFTKNASFEDISCMGSPAKIFTPHIDTELICEDDNEMQPFNGVPSSGVTNERMHLNPLDVHDTHKDNQEKCLLKTKNEVAVSQELKNCTMTTTPSDGGLDALGLAASKDQKTPLLTCELPRDDIVRPFYDIAVPSQYREKESNLNFERDSRGEIYHTNQQPLTSLTADEENPIDKSRCCDSTEVKSWQSSNGSEKRLYDISLIKSLPNTDARITIEFPTKAGPNDTSNHVQDDLLQWEIHNTDGEKEEFLSQRQEDKRLKRPETNEKEQEALGHKAKSTGEKYTKSKMFSLNLLKKDSNSSVHLECPQESREDQTSEESVLI